MLTGLSSDDVLLIMQRGARAVQRELGIETLFVLLVFDDPTCAQYISTCDRETIIKAMRECAARLERGEGEAVSGA